MAIIDIARLVPNLVEYNASPNQAVDRWYQCGISSNAATIARCLSLACGRGPGAVIDPFCGGGSSGVAARILGATFIGVESSPVLNAIATTKSLAGPEHIMKRTTMARPRARIGVRNFESIAACAQILVGARTFLRDTAVDTEVIRLLAQDMRSLAVRSPESVLLRSDSTRSSIMDLVDIPSDMPWAVYTSPPFPWSDRQPVFTPELVTEASLIFPPFDSKSLTRSDNLDSTLVASLGNYAPHCRRGVALIEIEDEIEDDCVSKCITRAIKSGTPFSTVEPIRLPFCVQGRQPVILCCATKDMAW